MTDLEKPGKCPVCERTSVFSRERALRDDDGDLEVYSAVYCTDCGYELSKQYSNSAEVISIWNRLSLSPVALAAPALPAVGVEADGGAGNGEEVE